MNQIGSHDKVAYQQHVDGAIACASCPGGGKKHHTKRVKLILVLHTLMYSCVYNCTTAGACVSAVVMFDTKMSSSFRENLCISKIYLKVNLQFLINELLCDFLTSEALTHMILTKR